MSRAFIIAVALLSGFSIAGVAAANPNIPDNVELVERKGIFTKYRLKSNGMPIYLSLNRVAPVATFMVVYHVGSRNEGPGYTGSVHLLEHLLAGKSTANFGTAKGNKTIPDLFRTAGANWNMTVGYDRMTAFTTVPSSSVALAMKVEADRLGRALILDEERQPEMTVVRNEYEIGENDLSLTLTKAVANAAFVAHPYRWPPIGYRSDIEGVSTVKLREIYKTYFWPNNAEAIIVGDFDTEAVLSAFDGEFGSFAASPTPIPAVITVEPPQEGERRVVVSRPGEVGLVKVGYIRPGALDPDFIPLDVLVTIVGAGVKSRLYQALVETQVATSIESSNDTLRDPYLFLVGATVAPGSTHQKTEDALKAVLYDIASNGVTEQEVRRAQKKIEVDNTRQRDGTQTLAINLAEGLASASWQWWDNYIDAVNRVTTADVQRVATRYLVPKHATVGWFVPATQAEPAGDRSSASVPTQPASSAARDPTPVPSQGPAGTVEPDARPFAQRTLRHVLKNGVTLNVVENRGVPSVALQATILAGRMTAPEGKPALPNLITRMLDRGTKTKSKLELAEALENVGAELAFRTNILDVQVTGSSLAGDVKVLLETFADELKNPALRPDELEKAKSELKAAVLEDFENTSVRAAERIINIVFPPQHPYRAPTREEMFASIDALTPDDIARFHRDRYNGSSLILAISGDVDANEISSMVEALFADIPTGERIDFKQSRTVPVTPVREAVTLRGKANVNFIYAAASSLRRNDADYEASLIANAALGIDDLSSRLGKRVRVTEGLSYTIRSAFDLSDFVDGVWAINVAVAPINLKAAIESTMEEVQKFYHEGITEEEVLEWKQYFANGFQVGLGSNAGIVAALVDAEKFGYGPAYLDDFPQRVMGVTRDQVNLAIKAHLHPTKLNLVVAGDVDSIPE